MKKNNKYIVGSALTLLALTGLILFFGCKKGETLTLGDLPSSDFTATIAADGHTVTLINNTDMPSIPYWKIPDLSLGYGDLQGDTLDVNFVFPDTYSITMLAVANGGIDSITKEVTTTQPDENACDDSTPLGFIASCTQKTWKLKPVAGAIWVSGGAGGESSWWANGESDVTDRSCLFNDTYTFVFDQAGDYIFDDSGDFYAEDYSGDPQWTCRESSTYPADQQNWASGNFHYSVTSGTGVNGLGQLKVTGAGAHIGLNKPINNNEVYTSTTTSVTYDIWEMTPDITDDLGTYDQLVLTFHYGNWSATEGWWTYTLISMH